MVSRYILLAAIAVLVVASAFVYYWQAGQNHTKPQLANSTHGPGKESFSQMFCVNGVNSSALSYMMNNGITCFRTDVSLNQGEMEFVSNSTKSGAQFLGILDYDTVGAHPSPSGCLSGCNWTLSDWNASVANAVEDYPEINTWEIYNEPLAGLFVSGYDNGSALDYFNMIKSAYTIIKSREPNATIVCFGGAEMFPLQSIEYEYPFYKQVWSYGASEYCSAISLHAYSEPYYNFSQEVGYNLTLGQFFNASLNLYENLTQKPIWITETGITSNNWTAGLNLSEQKQASFLTQDLSFFAAHPFVKRVYWFDAVDSSSGGEDYGLLNAMLQPKPAMESFLYFSRNSTG